MSKRREYAKYGLVLWAALCVACQQETPITSVIRIDGESSTRRVNPDLYGITLEEINHAIDGGLYAEMVQNRSFEDGVPPMNCPYDRRRNVLTTPNGFDMPFIRPDSIPGWRVLSPQTWMAPDTKELLNEKNRRSLWVAISASSSSEQGGVAAEGYQGGMSVRQGEPYHFSCYVKGASFSPKPLQVALVDSTGKRTLSDVYTLHTRNEWTHFRHTFTATEDNDHAMLTITSDSSQVFWLDVVSLFPETWKGRSNGQRRDLMEAIAGLHPRFVRFPGGAFAEGYTAGTYPVWKETVGDIAQRKHFWSVWGYGTTNGMGYHEYLQLCEDLGAEPIYVLNSGITSMTRRPRYESITEMDHLVQDALNAIGYANYPTDSLLGALRARNGHPQPFHLKYVEIGSENYGHEYTKRFALFREAIRKHFPEVTVISNKLVGRQMRSEWRDVHFNARNSFFLSNPGRFGTARTRHDWENTFVGEFGNMQSSEARSMAAAIGEACFLVGIEQYPDLMSRVAYSPLLGHVDYTSSRWPMLLFDNHRVVPSPSYYVMQMFGKYRGEEVVPSEVQTYMRPNITRGSASVYMFDNCYELTEVEIDGKPVVEGRIRSGGWHISPGVLEPVPNRWNYVLVGDSTVSDYVFSTRIRRTKGSEYVQFRVRNNGRLNEEQDYICFALGNGQASLFHQSGNVVDTLASTRPFPFSNNRWYDIRITCRADSILCDVDGVRVQTAFMRPYPSLASVTTFDHKHRVLYVKVVNTTQHEEKTELDFRGFSVSNEVEVIELAGDMESQNSFEQPARVRPVRRLYTFPMGTPKVYSFPPVSVSILKFKLSEE